MDIFYCPEINNDITFLPTEESRHCADVLRMKKGDTITLVDGAGNYYRAELMEMNPRKCGVRILETFREIQKKIRLHIAIAPTKNIDRFEWFLEKATEIGVDEITPVICEHSERKVIKPERLHKILISSIKQSGRAFLPLLNGMGSFNSFIAKNFENQRFIAHCHDASSDNLFFRSRLPYLKSVYNKGEDALILIGPEGDFSEEEITLAVRNGFQEISLGDSRLRTETAGIIACSIVNTLQ